MRFTEIPAKLQYPPKLRAKLSTLHSSVVQYVSDNYVQTLRFRQSVITAMNVLSYIIISGDSMPDNWSEDCPLSNLPDIDSDVCKSTIGNLYLEVKPIYWDLTPVESSESPIEAESKSESNPMYTPHTKTVSKNLVNVPEPEKYKQLTSKEDLYLKPPKVPQINVNKMWASGYLDGNQYCIYETLPVVPTVQNEISATTNVEYMSNSDLLRLFPNTIIPTRNPACYIEYENLKYDEELGTILPIEGYTLEQILENMIKYPHFYKLSKQVDGQIVNFYTTIEIDGELHKTLDIWDKLPESKKIPRNSELIKEYVIRRYLLERDIKGIKHKYPIFGSLDPFITLFMPPEKYAQRGYSDAVEIAKCCVKSRVSFKQTRNPVIRRLRDAAMYI